MEITKNIIIAEITGAKDHLIEDNAKLNENISKGIDEVQENMDTGMASVKENVTGKLQETQENMKSGLGNVNTNVDSDKKKNEEKSESVKGALEGILKDQVGLLLKQIEIMNANNIEQ